MTKLAYAGQVQMTALLVLSLFAAAPAHAAKQKPLRCTLVHGHLQARLTELADGLMAEHPFYQPLAKEKGAPTKCRGSFGEEQSLGEDWWVEFIWRDHSKLKIRSEPPETTIIEYNRDEGLTHPDDVISQTRQYAEQVGLQFDWTKPREADEAYLTQNGKFQVIEYEVADTHANAFVRLMYDRQQRLVGVWYSLAL